MHNSKNPMTTSILEKADAIINGDREKTYGNAGRNVRCIADFWNLYLNQKYDRNIHIKAEDVCAMMRFLKESRLINSPHDEDTLMDIAGYVGLAEKIRTPKVMTFKDQDFDLSTQDTIMGGPTTGRKPHFPTDNPDMRETPDGRRGQ